MKRAAFGHCHQVKKLPSYGDCVIEVRLKVEDYKELVALLDDESVFVIPAQLPENTPWGVVDLGDAISEKTQPAPSETRRERKESEKAAYLCLNEKFWEFMGDTTQMVISSETDCDVALKHLLGIETRKQLDTPGTPLAAWMRLSGQYQASSLYGDYPEAS